MAKNRSYSRGAYRPKYVKYNPAGQLHNIAKEYAKSFAKVAAPVHPNEQRRRVLRQATAMAKKYIPLPIPKTER